MKGVTMLTTLEYSIVAASFSRPRFSNDNAYAESILDAQALEAALGREF